MKQLTDLFSENKYTFSFELFPPKTETGWKNLKENLPLLADLQPDFMSVTYGAGGSAKDYNKTVEIVNQIQEKQIAGLAHLTCIGHSRQEIREILSILKQENIRNILALRGDPPKNQPDWKMPEDGFSYTYELCQFIREEFGDYFCVGVAGFPEGHINSPDLDTDAKYLKMKVEAGADFIITQLFFDNQDYYDYVKRIRDLGVTARVIPGIIPITNYVNIVNFTQQCGAKIPEKVKQIFEPIQNDSEATLKAGIEYAIQQSKDLLANGVKSIHFYALNKISPINTIYKSVKNN